MEDFTDSYYRLFVEPTPRRVSPWKRYREEFPDEYNDDQRELEMLEDDEY